HGRVRAAGDASRSDGAGGRRGRRGSVAVECLPGARSCVREAAMVPGAHDVGARAGGAGQCASEYVDRGVSEASAAMELTWLTVLASVVMGFAAVCVFIFAVKNDYFH